MTLSEGNMQIYVQTLNVYVKGLELQWNVLESKRIKSPASVLILISLQIGYYNLSASGNKYRVRLFRHVKIYLGEALSFPNKYLVPNWPIGYKRLRLFDPT